MGGGDACAVPWVSRLAAIIDYNRGTAKMTRRSRCQSDVRQMNFLRQAGAGHRRPPDGRDRRCLGRSGIGDRAAVSSHRPHGPGQRRAGRLRYLAAQHRQCRDLPEGVERAERRAITNDVRPSIEWAWVTANQSRAPCGVELGGSGCSTQAVSTDTLDFVSARSLQERLSNWLIEFGIGIAAAAWQRRAQKETW